MRPFAFVDEDEVLQLRPTQAMLNDEGSVVRVVHGPVPLWGARRGEDVMMTDVLAFDLRVYDPGAPVFASVKMPATGTSQAVLDVVLTPSDPGWRGMRRWSEWSVFRRRPHENEWEWKDWIQSSIKYISFRGPRCVCGFGLRIRQRFSCGSVQSQVASAGSPMFPIGRLCQR